MAWFGRLPEREKQYIRTLLAVFARFDNARFIKSEAREMARQLKPLGRGHSAKRLIDRYREFRSRGRDARCLVRKWKNGRQGQPEEFIKFWQWLAGQNKRDDGTSGAWRRLIHEYWAAGEHVPGYGTWQSWFIKTFPNKAMPKHCPTSTIDLPPGWSYANALRYLPKKSVVKAMRQGFKAAHDHQKHLQRDRSRLLPLQLVAIDDFWLDQMFYSTTLGHGKAFRSVGIMARDVATGCIVGWFIKPRTEDEFGKKQGIKQTEVKALLRLILEGQGLPPYPITFLVENAAASISQQTEAMLHANFGDRIKIERTGVYNDLLLKSGFPEKGGKPWEKSWVESYIRLIHTTAGHLPGQTGNRYDNAPGNLPQVVKYTERLLQHPELEREDLQKLRLPLLSFEDGYRIYSGILDLLEQRTDHKMQGFDKVTVWRREPGDPWQPESEMFQLTPEQAVQAEIVTRLESSAERWQRLCPPRGQWTEVPDNMLWYLMPEERPGRIANGKVVVHDKRIGHRPVEYWQEGSRLLRENEGRKVLVHYTPDEPDRIVLTTTGPVEQRRSLGILPRDNAVDLLDREAIVKAAGAIHRDRLADIRTVREICKEEDERLSRDKQFNQYVIEQAKERRSGPKVSVHAQDDALNGLTSMPAPKFHEDEDPLFSL